jgi:hypothetical protein
MNGRVQDPRFGFFISPDPLVQAPYLSQSYNRYAYVWNNPATLQDPSGFQTQSPNYTAGPCQEGMSGEECLTLISMDPSRQSNNYARPTIQPARRGPPGRRRDIGFVSVRH